VTAGKRRHVVSARCSSTTQGAYQHYGAAEFVPDYLVLSFVDVAFPARSLNPTATDFFVWD